MPNKRCNVFIVVVMKCCCEQKKRKKIIIILSSVPCVYYCVQQVGTTRNLHIVMHYTRIHKPSEVIDCSVLLLLFTIVYYYRMRVHRVYCIHARYYNIHDDDDDTMTNENLFVFLVVLFVLLAAPYSAAQDARACTTTAEWLCLRRAHHVRI